MKKIAKIIAMASVMVGVGMFMSTDAYAYKTTTTSTNQLGVENKTVELTTMDEAKEFEKDIRNKGIQCNYTLNCGTQEIVNYCNTNFANIPIARLYECIKIKHVPNNNSNSNNNSTQNNQNNNSTQNNQCEKNEQTTTNANVDKDKVEKTKEKENLENKDVDEVPKTGDSSKVILMSILLAVLVSITGVVAFIIKKRRYV